MWDICGPAVAFSSQEILLWNDWMRCNESRIQSLTKLLTLLLKHMKLLVFVSKIGLTLWFDFAAVK